MARRKSTPEQLDENKERQRLISAAQNVANRRLKEAHHDEWSKYMLEETAARNVEWKPRGSALAKAEATFDQLLAKYPHLADRVPQDEDELELSIA